MTGPRSSSPSVPRTVNTSRFGPLTVGQELVLSFPDGLIGFPGPRWFTLVPHSPESPFLWLQDLTDGKLAFPVTALDLPDSAAPTLLSPEERRQLNLAPGETPRLLGIVSVANGVIRMNRLGPIALNLDKRLGRQLVLDLPLPTGETVPPAV